LQKKIEEKSGRLQLLVAALSQLAWDLEQKDGAGVEEILDEIKWEVADYGHRWLDDTANILKEVYNARGLDEPRRNPVRGRRPPGRRPRRNPRKRVLPRVELKLDPEQKGRLLAAVDTLAKEIARGLYGPDRQYEWGQEVRRAHDALLQNFISRGKPPTNVYVFNMSGLSQVGWENVWFAVEGKGNEDIEDKLRDVFERADIYY
jgi:hypothetical protein